MKSKHAARHRVSEAPGMGTATPKRTDIEPAPAESPDLAVLQKELAAQKDDYLRLAADFDNFRKRTRRDSEQQSNAGKAGFISELLPALDNLERALSSGMSSVATPLREGVRMTLQQLGQLLHHHGIEAVEDVGLTFDPNRHEAVAVLNDPAKPDHSILEVTRRGYSCGERVFRPAMVIVNDWSHSPGVPDAG